MKAVSVKQPWASLIVEPDPNNIGFGIKDIENRTWKCPEKYIGQRVLIHSSANPAIEFKNICLLDMYQIGMTEEMIVELNKLPFSWKSFTKENGAIIGSVEIVGCVINHPSIWAEKTEVLTDVDGFPMYGKKIYNWVLANPIKFPEPIPAKGKLSFWEFELNEAIDVNTLDINPYK